MYLRRFLFVSICVVLSISFLTWSGCANNSSEQSDDGTPTSISVSFTVDMRQNTNSAAHFALGTVNDIASVTVKADNANDSSEVIPETAMTEVSPNVWRISLLTFRG